MLSRFANIVKPKAPPASPAAPTSGVQELLARLAAIRAKKAELDQEEKAVLVATATCLRQQQEALEELKRRVSECGIELEGGRSATYAPPVGPSARTEASAALSNS
jgi:hypothetical protein